jgi:hypothetical protein
VVSSLLAAEETGAMGREIKSRLGSSFLEKNTIVMPGFL